MDVSWTVIQFLDDYEVYTNSQSSEIQSPLDQRLWHGVTA